MDVALQLIAYKEPDLTATMDAWTAQPVPAWATVSYEAWVTPSDDPRYRCGTWTQAEAHDTFEAYEAPQYKLVARNAAHESAVRRGHDAFIACDADAPPLADETLSNLLTRTRAPGVGCVCANPIAPATPVGVYSNLRSYGKEVLARTIHGQCHAVTSPTWRAAGPFAEDIDHTSLAPVWREEEMGLSRRIRAAGLSVHYAYDAPVFNDTRRRECKWATIAPGRAPPYEYCEKPAGDETFAPTRES